MNGFAIRLMRRCLMGVCFIGVLTNTGLCDLPAVRHLSAERQALVWAWSEAGGPFDTDTRSSNIPSLGPLDRQDAALVTSVPSERLSSANAQVIVTQHSAPRPNGLDARCSVVADADGDGPVGSAECGGSAVFTWSIEVTRGTVLRLTGTIETASTDESIISLNGPDFEFVRSTNAELDPIELDEAIVAQAGTWTLEIRLAAGARFVRGGTRSSHAATYDIRLRADEVLCETCSSDCDGSGVSDAWEFAGRAYLGSRNSGRVYVIEPSELPGPLVRAIDLGSEYERIHAMAYDPVSRRVLIVADERKLFGADRFIWLDPRTEEVTVGAAAPGYRAVAFDDSGRLWAIRDLLGFDESQYVRVDTSTGAIIGGGPSVPVPFPSPHNLIRSPVDGLLYHWTNPSTLRRFNPSTSTVESTLTSGVSSFDGIAFTADGKRVFGMQSTNWYSVDPVTGGVVSLYPHPMAQEWTLGLVYVPILEDDDQDGIPDSCQCAGNIGNDTAVDIVDLTAVLSMWLEPVGVGSPVDMANSDGLIDVDDLNAVLSNWGASCP